MVCVKLGPARGRGMGARGGGTSTVRRRRPLLRLLRERERRWGRGLVVIEEEAAAAPLPGSRAECRGGPRPCPLVRCRYHLYLDVHPGNGSIKLNFPDREPWELPCSCGLDVAEAGGLTLDVVGALLGVTRERARQIQDPALARLARGLGL